MCFPRSRSSQLLWWILFGSPFLYGASGVSEVLELQSGGRAVWISQDSSRWKKDGYACIYDKGAPKPYACGLVIKVEGDRALLTVDFLNHEIRVGDRAAPPPEKKEIFTKEDGGPHSLRPMGDNIRYRSRGRARHAFSVGMNWDLEQFAPSLSYEHAVSQHVSYGLLLEYHDVTESYVALTGIEAFLTRTFYSQRSFFGINVLVGIGVYYFDASDGILSEKTFNPAALVNFAWRYKLSKHLGFKVGVGVQYVRHPGTAGLPIGQFYEFHPQFGGTVGFQY